MSTDPELEKKIAELISQVKDGTITSKPLDLEYIKVSKNWLNADGSRLSQDEVKKHINKEREEQGLAPRYDENGQEIKYSKEKRSGIFKAMDDVVTALEPKVSTPEDAPKEQAPKTGAADILDLPVDILKGLASFAHSVVDGIKALDNPASETTLSPGKMKPKTTQRE